MWLAGRARRRGVPADTRHVGADIDEFDDTSTG
jgi:hypothetical protein